MALREREFLVNRAERRLLAFAGRCVPLVQVEAGGDAALQRQAVVEVADELHAAFAPGAGDDRGFDEVALDAIERDRLVVFVEQTRRHQEQAGAQCPGRRQLAFDVSLFERHFTCVTGRCDRVFHFEFGHDFGLGIEAVLVTEHEAAQVGLCVLRRAGRAVVVDLAVAGEHGRWRCGSRVCGGRDRGRRHRERGHSGWRGRSALLLDLCQLGLHGSEFGGELIEPAREFGLARGLRESAARRKCETCGQAGRKNGFGGQGARAFECHGLSRGGSAWCAWRVRAAG